MVLINRKDNFRLLSDTLYYNTATGIARIDSHTILEGENDTIITTGGTYNTKTGFADLTRRSLILHRGRYTAADAGHYVADGCSL